jgi:hypothetical protein
VLPIVEFGFVVPFLVTIAPNIGTFSQLIIIYVPFLGWITSSGLLGLSFACRVSLT